LLRGVPLYWSQQPGSRSRAAFSGDGQLCFATEQFRFQLGDARFGLAALDHDLAVTAQEIVDRFDADLFSSGSYFRRLAKAELAIMGFGTGKDIAA
jgi:hypothetical protein